LLTLRNASLFSSYAILVCRGNKFPGNIESGRKLRFFFLILTRNERDTISRQGESAPSGPPCPSDFPEQTGTIRARYLETKYDTASPLARYLPTSPFPFLNYFRLPSIYTALYIDIHIEYTYINCVTSTSLRSLA